MTNLELDVKTGILSEFGALGQWGIIKRIRAFMRTLQSRKKGLKALTYLSNEQLADLGLERTKLDKVFKTSVTKETELNHLKRCVHLNGRAWG